MRRDVATSTLRGHLPTLRRDVGVRRISLFGSTARDEAREDGHLDLLVEFETGPTFDSFMGLKFFLEGQLGRKVDLVTPDALKPACALSSSARWWMSPGKRDWRLQDDDIIVCGLAHPAAAGRSPPSSGPGAAASRRIGRAP